MKNMVLLLAMMSMVVCTTLAQPGVDTQTRVFDSNFKSLQVKLSGNDYFPPIIMMGSDDVIEVRFDELSAELSYLRYSVVHCNANWQPSQLIDTEYLDGFNYANIENYEYSSGTFTHFVHYEFTLPNDEIRFTKSGNYLVQVYREDFPDEILLQARFMVCENVVGVYPSVSSRTDIDFNVGHQQVDITIDTRDYMVRDMYQDLAVCVSQNSRVDNEVWVGRPMRVMGNKVIYEHDRKLIFPAGNEYRRMETVAVNYPTMGVSQVEYYHPFYHATLHTDEPRTDIMYLYDKTQNGRFTIRNAEADDSDGRADYLVTHFSLATGERLTGGKVYIEGEFTNHLFNSSSLMRYDEASGCYVADILLKQGAYNYQYLFVPDGTNVGMTSTIEGDKYQTVNEYSVKVYNRQPGERYDRLVGFGMVFSGK
ncbi:MAG TPA: DUF5103 domain-containing protein [Candidatus Avimuribaculum pullicola]|nr:DUF5103 domain-containing protein [Candidatus Avimuribaculum pullicola]